MKKLFFYSHYWYKLKISYKIFISWTHCPFLFTFNLFNYCTLQKKHLKIKKLENVNENNNNKAKGKNYSTLSLEITIFQLSLKINKMNKVFSIIKY